MRVRGKALIALVAVTLLLAGGALSASAQGSHPSRASHSMSLVRAVQSGAHSAARFIGIEDGEARVAPGTLDDGKELLPKAKITIDQAVAAARTAATGDIGEIDLEHYQGRLVFKVDVGNHDVKVDAETGEVLGSGAD